MRTPEELARSSKLVRKEKKLNLAVLYYMFYKGKDGTFCRDMGLPAAIFKVWKEDYGEEAQKFIDEYHAKVKGEKKPNPDEEEPPTIDDLKKRILIKISKAVGSESDPSKLAATLKIINGYGNEEKEEKKAKKTSIYEEIKKNG